MQQLSSSAFRVPCHQPPCYSPGKYVPCYTGSWWSPERHMCQESDFSVCPSEKQTSAFPSHSSVFQAFSRNLCLVQQVHPQLHQLCCHLQAGFPASLFLTPASSSLPTTCLLPYYTRLHSGNLTSGQHGFYLTHQPSWRNHNYKLHS